MDTKRSFLVLACTAMLVVFSCTKVAEDDSLAPGSVGTLTKVINSPEGARSGAILVKFDSAPKSEDLDAVAALGFTDIEKVFTTVAGKEELERRFGLDRWYEARLSEGMDVEEAAASLTGLAIVQTVEFDMQMVKESDEITYPLVEGTPDTKGTASSTDQYPFNDPNLNAQWHYFNNGGAEIATNIVKGADINVKDTWTRLTCGDPDIIVAVVDEGVKYTHPDLAANMWTNSKEVAGNGVDDDKNGYVDDIHGYNFVNGGDIAWATNGNSGHGTHVAGTIAAVNNNKLGVCGVAGGSGNGDGCKIMSCQIFDGDSGGAASQTVQAIKYAGDNGASIISCSFGYTYAFSSDKNYFDTVGTIEADAIHYFEACRNNSVIDGGIAIFASGNEGHNYAHYPGALNDIISVSAFAPDFLPTYYTNYGPGCNITAPGGEAYLPPFTSYKALVLSTLPSEFGDGDYGYMQGTSMACPHVSGVVALALSYAKQRGKTFTRDEFKNMILSSTDDIDKKIGSGKKEYANNAKSIKLSDYYHKMGTGAIDTWRLMMQIDGIPCSTAQLGKKQWIDLIPYYGSSSVSLTYLGVTVPQATIDALGLKQISPSTSAAELSYAYIQFGRLYIHPTKIGSGTLTVKAVGGGDSIGGGTNPPGGMELNKAISIIVRDTDGGNGTGGWL